MKIKKMLAGFLASAITLTTVIMPSNTNELHTADTAMTAFAETTEDYGSFTYATTEKLAFALANDFTEDVIQGIETKESTENKGAFRRFIEGSKANKTAVIIPDDCAKQFFSIKYVNKGFTGIEDDTAIEIDALDDYDNVVLAIGDYIGSIPMSQCEKQGAVLMTREGGEADDSFVLLHYNLVRTGQYVGGDWSQFTFSSHEAINISVPKFLGKECRYSDITLHESSLYEIPEIRYDFVNDGFDLSYIDVMYINEGTADDYISEYKSTENAVIKLRDREVSAVIGKKENDTNTYIQFVYDGMLVKAVCKSDISTAEKLLKFLEFENIINYDFSDEPTDEGTISRATDKINGITYTVTAELPTEAGNIELKFAASEKLPFGQKMTAEITDNSIIITVNAGEEFDSMDEFNQEMNIAITEANKGMVHKAGYFKVDPSILEDQIFGVDTDGDGVKDDWKPLTGAEIIEYDDTTIKFNFIHLNGWAEGYFEVISIGDDFTGIENDTSFEVCGLDDDDDVALTIGDYTGTIPMSQVEKTGTVLMMKDGISETDSFVLEYSNLVKAGTEVSGCWDMFTVEFSLCNVPLRNLGLGSGEFKLSGGVSTQREDDPNVVNDVKYTVTADNPTIYGDLTLNFKISDSLPDDCKMTAVLTDTSIEVTINSNAEFGSFDEFNNAMNDAITTANGGVKHPAGYITVEANMDETQLFYDCIDENGKKEGRRKLTGAEMVEDYFGVNFGTITLNDTAQQYFSIGAVSSEFTGIEDDQQFSIDALENDEMCNVHIGDYVGCIPMSQVETPGSVLMMRDGYYTTDSFVLNYPNLIEAGYSVDGVWSQFVVVSSTSSAPSRDLGIGNINFVIYKADELTDDVPDTTAPPTTVTTAANSTQSSVSVITVTSIVPVTSVSVVTSIKPVESVVTVTSVVPVESVVTKESVVTVTSIVPVESAVTVTSVVPVESVVTSVSKVTSIEKVTSISVVTSFKPVTSVSVVTSIKPITSVSVVTSIKPITSIVTSVSKVTSIEKVTSIIPITSVSVVTSIKPVTSVVTSISKVTSVSIVTSVKPVTSVSVVTVISIISSTQTGTETKFELNLVKGDNAKLTIKGYSGTVKWLSKDNGVAGVDDGTVTAVKYGKTTISAQAGDYILTCDVTVSFKGDTNRDGKLSISDVVAMQKSMVNTGAEKINDFMDVNDDGIVNVFDMIALKRMVINLI